MSDDGSFEFVEGATGDLSFVARGRSASAVFRAAAEALAAATVERIDAVDARVTRSVRMHDTQLDLLLLRFLNELIYLRDAEGLVLRPRTLRVRPDNPPELEADLVGEPIDAERHGLGHEAKAATAHNLSVRSVDAGWEASVTLDV